MSNSAPRSQRSIKYIKTKFEKAFNVENILPVYFLFLTGAYFVLLSPHFNITTPGLDFQLFKTLITASSSKELGFSQHYLDSLLLEHFVDSPCFWNQAIICFPEPSAATKLSPHMKRLAQQEAIQALLVDCCDKSELLWQLYTVLHCKIYYDSSSRVSFRQMTHCLELLKWLLGFSTWLIGTDLYTFPIKKKYEHTYCPENGTVCSFVTALQHKSQSLLLCSAVQNRWFLCKRQ